MKTTAPKHDIRHAADDFFAHPAAGEFGVLYARYRAAYPRQEDPMMTRAAPYLEREREAARRLADALRPHVTSVTTEQEDTFSPDIYVTTAQGRDHVVSVIDLGDTIQYRVHGNGYDPLVTCDADEIAAWLGAPRPSETALDALGLSVRPYNALRRHGIDTVEHLASLTDREIRSIRNLGTKSFREVKDALSRWEAR